MMMFSAPWMRCCIVGVLVAFNACTQGQPHHPLPLLSHLRVNDSKVYTILSHERHDRLSTCSRDRTCEQAHFISALIAFHEDESVAFKHFREAIALAPRSQVAELSASWLKLLEAGSAREHHMMFIHTISWILTDLLNRQYFLRNELDARDKKIEQMSRQLKVLKQIDFEISEKCCPPNPTKQSPPPPPERTSP
jgi:hypothetical protein